MLQKYTKKWLFIVTANLSIAIFFLSPVSVWADPSVRTVPTIINKAIRINTGHVMRKSIAASRAGAVVTHKTMPRINSQSSTSHVRLIRPHLKITSKYSNAMTSLCFSPDKQWLLTGNKNGAAQLWNLNTGQKQFSLNCGCGSVSSVAFVHIKKQLFAATGHSSGMLCLWKINSGRKLSCFKADEQEIIFIGNGLNHDLITAATNSSVKIWNSDIPKLKKRIPVKGLLTATVTRLGDQLITGTADGRITCLHLKTYKEISVQKTGAPVSALDIYKNRFLAAGAANGHVQVWSLQSFRKILDRAWHKQTVSSISFNRNGTIIASAADDGVIVLTALAGRTKIGTLKGHTGKVNALKYSFNNHALLSAGNDKVVRVWDTRFKKESCRLISMRDGWAVISGTGFFDGNLDGAVQDRLAAIHWQFDNMIFNLESFVEAYYKPGLLSHLIQGKQLLFEGRPNLLKQGIYLPPTVTILEPVSGAQFTGKKIDIKFSVQNRGGGIDEVRVFQNDKIVFNDFPDSADQEIDDKGVWHCSVDLIHGKNEFSITGISYDRIESKTAKLIVYSKGKHKRAPAKLHTITIGINKYKSPMIPPLDYAVPDAKAVSAVFKKTYVKLFAELRQHELYNEHADQKSILTTLALLAGSGAQQDTIVLYFSGHGEVIGDTWYFIPYDLTSPNDSSLLKENAISSQILQNYIARIPALKIFLMLDCCKAGAVVTAFDQTATKRPFALMSRFTGIHIAAAASKNASALELDVLNHGLFTYSFLEGIKESADISPVDAKVSVMEIMQYIKKDMPFLTSKYQIPFQVPVLNSMGKDFIISLNP